MVGTTAAAEEEGAMEGAVAEAAAAAAESTSLCVEKAKIKRSESTSESPMIYLVNVEKVNVVDFNHIMLRKLSKVQLTLTRDITPVFFTSNKPCLYVYSFSTEINYPIEGPTYIFYLRYRVGIHLIHAVSVYIQLFDAQ
jgi:hypothetical protein